MVETLADRLHQFLPELEFFGDKLIPDFSLDKSDVVQNLDKRIDDIVNARIVTPLNERRQVYAVDTSVMRRVVQTMQDKYHMSPAPKYTSQQPLKRRNSSPVEKKQEPEEKSVESEKPAAKSSSFSISDSQESSELPIVQEVSENGSENESENESHKNKSESAKSPPKSKVIESDASDSPPWVSAKNKFFPPPAEPSHSQEDSSSDSMVGDEGNENGDKPDDDDSGEDKMDVDSDKSLSDSDDLVADDSDSSLEDSTSSSIGPNAQKGIAAQLPQRARKQSERFDPADFSSEEEDDSEDHFGKNKNQKAKRRKRDDNPKLAPVPLAPVVVNSKRKPQLNPTSKLAPNPAHMMNRERYKTTGKVLSNLHHSFTNFAKTVGQSACADAMLHAGQKPDSGPAKSDYAFEQLLHKTLKDELGEPIDEPESTKGVAQDLRRMFSTYQNCTSAQEDNYTVYSLSQPLGDLAEQYDLGPTAQIAIANDFAHSLWMVRIATVPRDHIYHCARIEATKHVAKLINLKKAVSLNKLMSGIVNSAFITNMAIDWYNACILSRIYAPHAMEKIINEP